MPMTFGVVGDDATYVLTQGSGGLATRSCKRHHSPLRTGRWAESLLETPIQERAATRLTDSTKVQQITGDGPWRGLVESYASIHGKKGARAYASDRWHQL